MRERERENGGNKNTTREHQARSYRTRCQFRVHALCVFGLWAANMWYCWYLSWFWLLVSKNIVCQLISLETGQVAAFSWSAVHTSENESCLQLCIFENMNSSKKDRWDFRYVSQGERGGGRDGERKRGRARERTEKWIAAWMLTFGSFCLAADWSARARAFFSTRTLLFAALLCCGEQGFQLSRIQQLLAYEKENAYMHIYIYIAYNVNIT